MIINDSFVAKKNTRLNEAKTVDLGGGSSAYQYNGKYYIKKGDSRKEISADQYQKLLNKDTNNSSNTNDSYKSNELSKSFIESDATFDYEYCLTLNDGAKNRIDHSTHDEVNNTFGTASKAFGVSKDNVLLFAEDDSSDNEYLNKIKDMEKVETLKNDYGESMVMYKDTDGTPFIIRNSWGLEEVLFIDPRS